MRFYTFPKDVRPKVNPDWSLTETLTLQLEERHKHILKKPYAIR